MKKDLVTTELLGIRSGLSIISKYTDEIKEQESRITGEQAKTSDAQRLLNYAERQRQEIQKQYDEAAEAHAYHINRLSQHQENGWRQKASIKFWAPMHIAIYIVLTVFFFALFWVLLPELVGGAIGVLFVVLGLILPIPLSYFVNLLYCLFSYSSRKNKETATQYYSRKQEIERELARSSSQLKKIDGELSAADAQIHGAIQALQDQKKRQEEVTARCQIAIHALAEKSQAVNQALLDTYGFFLSETDWQNIDLIIHYMETGRADNMKEALFQVDRQRQTDQIVRAIQDAKSAICKHIESAFSRMGEALSQSFSRLDARLQSISGQLSSYQETAASSNRQLMEKLDMQISATRMNTVLLEKANTSSDELIHDLRYNQRYWVK